MFHPPSGHSTVWGIIRQSPLSGCCTCSNCTHCASTWSVSHLAYAWFFALHQPIVISSQPLKNGILAAMCDNVTMWQSHHATPPACLPTANDLARRDPLSDFHIRAPTNMCTTVWRCDSSLLPVSARRQLLQPCVPGAIRHSRRPPHDGALKPAFIVVTATTTSSTRCTATAGSAVTPAAVRHCCPTTSVA